MGNSTGRPVLNALRHQRLLHKQPRGWTQALDQVLNALRHQRLLHSHSGSTYLGSVAPVLNALRHQRLLHPRSTYEESAL